MHEVEWKGVFGIHSLISGRWRKTFSLAPLWFLLPWKEQRFKIYERGLGKCPVCEGVVGGVDKMRWDTWGVGVGLYALFAPTSLLEPSVLAPGEAGSKKVYWIQNLQKPMKLGKNPERSNYFLSPHHSPLIDKMCKVSLSLSSVIGALLDFTKSTWHLEITKAKVPGNPWHFCFCDF